MAQYQRFPGRIDQVTNQVGNKNNPGVTITDTNDHTGLDGSSVYFISQSVINSATTPNLSGSINGQTFLAGQTLPTRVTQLRLTSGSAIVGS